MLPFLTMAQELQLFCRYKRLDSVLRRQISVGSFSSSHRRTSCSRCTILLMSSQKRLLSNDPAVFGGKGHKIIPSRICPKKDLTTREYIPSHSPIYRRCAKRKQRSLSSNNGSSTVHYLNRACHMKIEKG